MCGSCFLIRQLFYVFWLEHLIHLCLRLLSIGSYSLPFFHTRVPLSFTVFLLVLKANPLASLAELVWRRHILWDFFCLGSSLFGFPFNWESCWKSILDCRSLVFITWNISCHSLLAWLFPSRSQLLVLSGLPCMLLPVSPLLPLTFSLCLGILPF